MSTSSIFSAIQYVNSPYSLAAFAIAGVVTIIQTIRMYGYKSWRDALRNSNSSDRGAIIEKLKNKFDIPIPPTAVNEQNVVAIVDRFLKYKQSRTLTISGTAFAAFIITVICAFLEIPKKNPKSNVAVASTEPTARPVSSMEPSTQPTVVLDAGNLPAGATAGSQNISFDSTVGHKVFNFDGDNKYVEVDNLSLPYSNAERSVTLWVNYRSDQPGINESFLVGYGTFGTPEKSFTLTIVPGGDPAFTDWGRGISCVTPLTKNVWHYLAVTTDEANQGTYASLYVDGSLCAANTFPDINTPKDTPLLIGALTNFTDINRTVDGEIGRISVYDYPLSPENIQFLFAQGPD